MTRSVFLCGFGVVLAAACGRQELPRGGFRCPEFQVRCGDACTDTSRSAEHCGACGAACLADEECIASKCRPICDADETRCASGCVDADNDPDNCGACKNACEPGQMCRSGRCQGSGCGVGELVCDGECVDVASDALHCGGCFQECDEGFACAAGRCVEGCPGEQLLCDGECIDPGDDADHCGNCLTACAPEELCVEGACVPDCPSGLTACGEYCADLESDLLNCGACFRYCALGRTCSNGLCCPPGSEACDGACRDLASDPAHCGGCSNECAGVCSMGVCQPVCAPGTSQCGDTCVDLNRHFSHCGACGNACDPGRTCLGGQCLCANGTSECGDACVSLLTDPNNCGSCGVKCDEGEYCAGACVPTCPGSQVVCGNSCVDTSTHPDNCGGCGVACEAGFSCRLGQCTENEVPCDWSQSAFPYALNDGISVSDVTMDDACNLYVGIQRTNTNSGGYIYAIPYRSSQATPIAEFDNLVRGLSYRRSDGLLYAAVLDRIVSLGVDGSNPRELDGSVVGQYLNGMTVAPSAWGQFGDQLLVAKSTGEILAFDPDNPTPVAVATVEGFLSDLEFDGPQLYAAAYSAWEIVRVTPGGAITPFVSLPCAPDGLTVETGSRLWVACGSTQPGEIHTVGVAQGDVDFVVNASLNSGWAPSGMLWNNGNLFVVEERVGLTSVVP